MKKFNLDIMVDAKQTTTRDLNKLTRTITRSEVSKGDMYYMRDWAEPTCSEPLSQDDVNEIPFIDCSPKTIAGAMVVFAILSFLTLG